MAVDLGLGAPGWEIHRCGTELDPRPGAMERALFIERVEPGRETWEEGLIVMHNPHAKVPLPISAFEGVTQIQLVDDELSYDFRGRTIFSQLTVSRPVADRALVLEQMRQHLRQAKEHE